jgi:hypothetical protein
MIRGWQAINPWAFKIPLGRPHARLNTRLFLAWCFVLVNRSLISQGGKFQTWMLRFHKSDVHSVTITMLCLVRFC